LLIELRYIGIEYDITDIAARFIVLGRDVDGMASERVVQLSEHARDMALDLDEARSRRSRWQLHLREVDGAMVEPLSL
jgi:hypothetical protein